LLGIWDHHANVLPRLSYAKHFGYKVKYFYLKEDYTVDYEDFQKQYTDDVKVVAC
jgi:selenocysteine lyase/cysteine desulfurase